MSDIATIRRGTVIIDDISWLTDVSSRDYVIKLLEVGGKHVILIGRAKGTNFDINLYEDKLTK
jgi:hypothetical protein